MPVSALRASTCHWRRGWRATLVQRGWRVVDTHHIRSAAGRDRFAAAAQEGLAQPEELSRLHAAAALYTGPLLQVSRWTAGSWTGREQLADMHASCVSPWRVVSAIPQQRSSISRLCCDGAAA